MLNCNRHSDATITANNQFRAQRTQFRLRLYFFISSLSSVCSLLSFVRSFIRLIHEFEKHSLCTLLQWWMEYTCIRENWLRERVRLLIVCAELSSVHNFVCAGGALQYNGNSTQRSSQTKRIHMHTANVHWTEM